HFLKLGISARPRQSTQGRRRATGWRNNTSLRKLHCTVILNDFISEYCAGLLKFYSSSRSLIKCQQVRGTGKTSVRITSHQVRKTENPSRQSDHRRVHRVGGFNVGRRITYF